MTSITLHLLSSENYFSQVGAIIKKEVGQDEVIYVTTNQPYENLISLFNEQKISLQNFYFIDCNSKATIKKKYAGENCYLLKNPRNLSDLSTVINDAISILYKSPCLFFDSLTTLSIYHSSETMERFTIFLTNKLRLFNVKTIIFALESDTDPAILQKISLAVDQIKKSGERS